MTDPRNSLPDAADTIEFEAPSVEETGRFRTLIDLHRDQPSIYREVVRRENHPDDG